MVVHYLRQLRGKGVGKGGERKGRKGLEEKGREGD